MLSSFKCHSVNLVDSWLLFLGEEVISCWEELEETPAPSPDSYTMSPIVLVQSDDEMTKMSPPPPPLPTTVTEKKTPQNNVSLTSEAEKQSVVACLAPKKLSSRRITRLCRKRLQKNAKKLFWYYTTFSRFYFTMFEFNIHIHLCFIIYQS